MRGPGVSAETDLERTAQGVADAATSTHSEPGRLVALRPICWPSRRLRRAPSSSTVYFVRPTVAEADSTDDEIFTVEYLGPIRAIHVNVHADFKGGGRSGVSGGW